jgi:2-oxoglutarate ferredoxin oxidoreductase subunit alpha
MRPERRHLRTDDLLIYAVLSKSFGPQIRGGESSFRLRIAAGRVYAVSGTLNVAIALNWDDFQRFGAGLPIGTQTTVICEAECATVPEGVALACVRPSELVAAPITRLARESGSDKVKNTVVLGLLSAWLIVR